MLCAATLSTVTAQVAGGSRAPYSGRPVSEVLDEIRASGTAIAYSSRLVSPELIVKAEPIASEGLAIAREILEAHELTLQLDAGVYLVVRMATDNRSPKVVPTPLPTVTPTIENITVSASRYEISRDASGSKYFIDRRTIQSMPDVGEDPIRITHRLPGAAASGASARAHFRGGELGEVGIVLNGHRLFDPFHVRDYQNIFSAIDARAIEGVEVYTGGFPVRFGDRMSGLVLMESLEAEKSRHTEIGLSAFNTSFLIAGNNEDKRWLFSARRGNLDLLIDPKFGEPSYYDVFAQFQFDATPDMTVSVNGLYADDLISVVLETDPDEREAASSKTRNAQVWLQLDNRWSDRLSSSTTASYISFSNRRLGLLSDEEKMDAVVDDVRDIEQVGVRQDWSYSRSDKHLMQWGFDFSHSDARYDYRGQAEYFGLQALYQNAPADILRVLTAAPSGASYALYFADRRKLSSKTILEWGLRWDDQTYTGLVSDSQLSPRVSLLRSVGENTELRLSWGRYHQSQGIQELQIEDGIDQFWPAQRADHLIAGLTHNFANKVSLRVEVFQKEMQRVRPRFENLYDPLGLLPELQADRVRLDPSSAKSSGLEVSLDGESGDWLWWGSYTLSKARDRIAGNSELRSWDQRHAVQGGLRWSHKAWDVALAAGVHTGWPTTDLTLEQDGTDADGEPIYVAIPGPRNALNVNTFASVDFRLSRTFDVPRGSLMLFFEVTNAFNRNNVCCVDWDVEFEVGEDPELDNSFDYWLPVLPAIGILWEF